MRNSEEAGIKKTPSGQGSSTEYQDSQSTYLSTKRKDAKGKLSSDELYEEYLKRQSEDCEETANKKENKTGTTKDTPCRKSKLESIPEMDLRQYCDSGLADKIGLEKVSQSKKDDFTGIQPCHKWPCEFVCTSLLVIN